MQAANALLDRGWEKAPQYFEKLNLGVSYIDCLDMIAKEESEVVKEVEIIDL